MLDHCFTRTPIMREWSFSETAEWVVGALLALTLVVMIFV
jgi:hypothetical protein